MQTKLLWLQGTNEFNVDNVNNVRHKIFH